MQRIKHCELRELKHQLGFLDRFWIAQLTVAYIWCIFLGCSGIYAVHLVEMLRHMCSEFCCDVVAYVLCILLRCYGIYAVNFVVMWHMCCASCCIVWAYMLFILY